MQKQGKPNALYSLKKTPTQARSKATVEAVLDAGAQLLVTIGYDKASTNKIAERAGVSIGSLYEYFPGKEAVFAEIRRRESRRVIQATAQSPTPASLREMLRLHITDHINHFLSNLDLHVALNQEVPRFAVIDEETKQLSSYFTGAKALLKERSDQIREERDIQFALELVVRIVNGTINEYALLSPDRLQDKAFADELLDLLENYLVKQ